MLNGSTLNGAMLNGSAGRFLQQQVSADHAYTWALRVIVGGVERTADLTGTVEVDREEGAAGIATLALYLAESPVVPSAWIGREVTIDYLSQSASGSADVRRFTGRIAEPVWDPLTRIMSCQCTDTLQQRVEALSVADIDALVGGNWSADLFEPVDGRSRWDYAQERLESLPASLDCSPSGALRVTRWYAQPASYVFGPGTTLYESVQIDLPLLGDMTNVVEIECAWRFPRLWQRNQNYTWTHPGTGGIGGVPGYCEFVPDSTDLLTRTMVEEAVSGIGLHLITATYYPLPPSGNYCDPLMVLINPSYPEVLLGVDVEAGERWAQQVTEQYRIRLEVAPGIAQAGEIIARQSASASVESEQVAAWEEDAFDGGSTGHTELREESRRVELLECLLAQASAKLVAAHRGSTVSWQVPTSLALAADLAHTLEIDDQGVHALGKCRRIVDAFDLEAGTALTTLAIAVMRGGAGEGDPLTVPARSERATPPGGSVGATEPLPTQLGGRHSSPPYDDTLPGFAGNYDNEDGGETYPHRFDLISAEIPAEDRDEEQVEIAATYRVSIPDDVLELT